MFRGNFTYLILFCTVVLASCNSNSYPDKPCACKDLEEKAYAELFQMENEIQKYNPAQKSNYKELLEQLFDKADFSEKLYKHCQKVYENNRDDKCSMSSMTLWDCGEYVARAKQAYMLRKKYTGDWVKDSLNFGNAFGQENQISLESYLKREKYGSWPILYGPYWDRAAHIANTNDTLYAKQYVVRSNGEFIKGFETEKLAYDYIKVKKLRNANVNQEYVIVELPLIKSDSMSYFPRMFRLKTSSKTNK